MLSGLVLLVCSVAIIACTLGLRFGMQSSHDARQERDQLKKDLLATKAELQDVVKKQVQVSVGAQIDREATEEVRLLVKDLEEQITDQKEEIAFYRGMMAPTERERGLSIRSWEVTDTGIDHHYQFRLVVQQLAVKHRVIKGYAKVNIVGLLDGQQKTLYLWSLSQQITKEEIKLRFKYFQAIDGELELPLGFKPQRVEVVAQTTGKKPVQVERIYEWQVRES